mgnify:FL=1
MVFQAVHGQTTTQLNTNQYYELYWEAMRNYRMDNGYSAEEAAAWASSNVTGNLGINPYGSAYPEPIGHDGKLVAGAKPLWDDSWDDALSQDAHYTDLNVRVSGGSKTSKYFVSAVTWMTKVLISALVSNAILSAPT